ncbi:MAG: ThuA domain-containing protein [Verrucomicrobiota bacterium]
MRPFFVISILGLSPLVAREIPIRALLVCGGCCHDYEKQAAILRDGIQAMANIQVDVVRSEDKGTSPWFPMYEKADWAKGYDVVIHDECAADITDENYIGNIVNAHKAGLPAVNLHCAMHGYRTGSDLWFEFLGLQSSSHGPQLPIAIDFKGAEHPITKGMADWTTVNEELYNNVKIFDEAKPLALGNQTQKDGRTDTAVIAWTHDYHGTRVFGTTLGHNNDTVGDKRYLELVVRGLLWSCGKLDAKYLEPYAGPAGHFDVVAAQGEQNRMGKIPADATRVEVTASSTQDKNSAWRVADGSRQSRWCAENESFPQWLQIEFAEPKSVSGLEVLWESRNNIYQHKVEGSVDGKNWSALAESGADLKPGRTHDSFAAAEVKFIRVTATGSSEGGWACIREIKAIGKDIGPLFAKLPEGDAKVTDPNKNQGNIRPSIPKYDAKREAEILQDVKVADGFEVSLFSTSEAANYPVYVAASPSGDLYVASDGNGSLGRDPGRGRILRLRDVDHDGRADEVTEFVKNLDSPRGLVWDHDRLYVVHPPNVSCFIDHDGDGRADEQKTLVSGIAFGFADRPADHTTNGLTLGIDGWLYVAGGDFGFMDAVGSDGRHLQHRNGGVIRFRPDGSGLEIFSTGTRNILGTPVSPLLDIFARDNTNDGGGWDVRFHHFTGLDDHGYPRLYKNFQQEIVQPLADYGGGSGCGSVYLSEPGIPTQWNDAPLTCDWGTGALWKQNVEPRGATFRESAPPEALVKMTRPTDADVDGMSSIYQASWKGATFKWEGPDVGYIVRVKPKGYTPEPLPDFEKVSDAELVKLLESPSQVRTLEAQRAILRRVSANAGAINPLLLTLAANGDKELPARVAALYALTQQAVKGAQHQELVNKVARLATDPKLQRFVMRALADAGLDQLPEGKTIAPEAIYAAGLESAEPRTRVEAIIGATRQNMKSLASRIMASADHADAVVAHTAFRGLASLGASDACFAVLDSPESSPEKRLGALRALMRMHKMEVVDGLILRGGKASDKAAREGILAALCRLHFHEGEWKGDSWGTRPDTRGPYYQPENWSATAKVAAFLKSTLDQASPEEAAYMLREMSLNRIEFDGGLERLLELAKGKPEMLAEVVAQLATRERIPQQGIAFLIEAARSDGPKPMILQAVERLREVDSEDACLASLAALETLAQSDADEKLFDQARKSVLGGSKLENHHQRLEDLAEQLDGAKSMWADAALLALSSRKQGSPEARELSEKAIAHGWETPSRRVQILKAIQASGFRRFDDKVLTATNDADPEVAKTAAAVVKALNIKKRAKDESPVVGTLSPDKVIAAVVGMRGDVAVGEQMFARQTCVACHAVTLEEAQKGPYLGTISQTYTREVLTENILDPQKTIAQGFATELITLKDGSQQMVFITLESAEEVKGRNIAGQEFSWKTGDVAKREKIPVSMMPPGLANSMTTFELASLLDYLESLSKKE